MSTDPIGTADVRAAYDAVASDYAGHFPDTGAEHPLELAVLDAFVVAVRVGALEGSAPLVLDAGCGTGRISRHLADRGLAVTGVDLSPGMVAQARAARPDIQVAVGSLSDLPHADDVFDGVLLWYSAIHTPPSGQPALYAEAARVLRPGGHLVVAFQHGTGVHDVAPAYRRFGHEVRLERHRFTADEVAGWATGAGLVEAARMVRRPGANEVDGQAVVLARKPG